MTKNQMKGILFKIQLDYIKKGILIAFYDDMKGGEAYIESKIVKLEKKYYTDPSEWGLFTMLHEIGHIMTNNNKQKRCLQEFLATQFAIDKCREYKIPVSKVTIETYQEYIWKWRKRSVKQRGKNVPTVKQLTLKY